MLHGYDIRFTLALYFEALSAYTDGMYVCARMCRFVHVCAMRLKDKAHKINEYACVCVHDYVCVCVYLQDDLDPFYSLLLSMCVFPFPVFE